MTLNLHSYVGPVMPVWRQAMRSVLHIMTIKSCGCICSLVTESHVDGLSHLKVDELYMLHDSFCAQTDFEG